MPRARRNAGGGPQQKRARVDNGNGGGHQQLNGRAMDGQGGQRQQRRNNPPRMARQQGPPPAQQQQNAHRFIFRNNRNRGAGPAGVLPQMEIAIENGNLSSESDEEPDEEEEDFGKLNPMEVLGSVFSDRYISSITTLSPGAGLQAMGNFIIENPEKFPKKIKEKIDLPQDQLEPTFLDMNHPILNDGNHRAKLLDVFFEDFREHFEQHFSRRSTVIYDKMVCNRLLHQHFPFARTPLIEHLVEEFNGRYSTAAWICFFVESKFSYWVRRYFIHVDHANWVIMSTPMPGPRKRRINWLPDPEDGPIADSIRDFRRALRRFRADYEELFLKDCDRLMPDADKIVEVGDEEKFECSVCLSNYPMSRAICCNSVGRIHVVDLIVQRGPSTSANSNVQPEPEVHRFCVECLVGHARAATQEMPLAPGGIGLQCMAGDCDNPILFSECRFYLPPNVRRQLNARIVQENLGKAQLDNLEGCNECNFAMVIEAPFDELRVFSCRKCKSKHCRRCKRVWDDLHFGRRCDEMATAKDHKRHAIENKMSEAIIRKCSRCSLPFVKETGCNKMTCRCGVTQCYICRAKNINYNHFCQHFRTPGQKTNCKQCKRICLLWQPEQEADQRALELLYAEANSEGIVLSDQMSLVK